MGASLAVHLARPVLALSVCCAQHVLLELLGERLVFWRWVAWQDVHEKDHEPAHGQNAAEIIWAHPEKLACSEDAMHLKRITKCSDD